jgi:NDP-sugar pyrophosphorylase family protein
MQAVILAGGTGARLQPYTTVVPKPLMPVGEYPILEIIIRQLRRAGVERVVLAVGYLGQLIEAFFQDGRRYGLAIEYSFEAQPLGTAGPVALVLDRLEEDFLVLNGDLLTTLSYRRLFDYHRATKAAATLGVYPREVTVDFGIVETDGEGLLQRYVEKPTHRFEVSMGVYALHGESVRPYLTPGTPLDLPTLMVRLRGDGLPVRGYREPCYWLDIGRMDDYQTAVETFEARKAEFLPGPDAP